MSETGEEDLDARLAELQAQEQDLSAARRKLHDRLANFPNEVTAEQERQVSKERRELHAQIDALRARRSAARRQQGGFTENESAAPSTRGSTDDE